MEAVDEADERDHYSDGDINQGFQQRHVFHPLQTMRSLLNRTTRIHSDNQCGHSSPHWKNDPQLMTSISEDSTTM